MKPIYEPQGKAREYSPLALNIYSGCLHKCRYCWVPIFTHNSHYFEKVEPRQKLLESLEKQLSKEKFDKQVLLSFIGDPYNSENKKHQITRQVLEILLEHRIPVAILTKGGTNCLADIETFRKFGFHIKIGASLTFLYDSHSLEFEPGAPLPGDRIEALKELHEKGIPTWASLEPVIDPNQSLQIIHETSDFVDHYKVGKINHFKEYETRVDWEKFLIDSVTLLRRLYKPFYIKHSLQIFNRSIKFEPQEIDQDFLCVVSFAK
jgi:DNA repair photolyase